MNTYTQMLPSVQGSRLSVPGVMKYLMSNYTYKNIFEQLSAGGKREYNICLVLDRTISMDGEAGAQSHRALIIFAHTLAELGIHDFTVLSFDNEIRVLKSADTPLDAVTKLALLSASPCSGRDTMDGVAILAAVQAMSSSRVAGKKFAFVFTDGFTSARYTLAKALRAAETEQTTVIAVAVGEDDNDVASCYQHYIVCSHVRELPEAIQLWQSGGGGSVSHSSSHSSGAAGVKDVTSQLFADADHIDYARLQSTLDTTWNALGADIETALTLEVVVTPVNQIKVDLCFLMDSTYSMEPYINMAREHIRSIVGDVKEVVKEREEELELCVNIAVVTYTDHRSSCRPGQCASGCTAASAAMLDFTSDIQAFERLLGGIQCDGGSDLPEDLTGGLHRVTKLNWTSQSCRILVWIGDYPCHGSKYQVPSLVSHDNFPGGDPCGHDPEELLKQLVHSSPCAVNFLFTQAGRVANPANESFFGYSQPCRVMLEHFDKTLRAVGVQDGAKLLSIRESTDVSLLVNALKGEIATIIANDVL